MYVMMRHGHLLIMYSCPFKTNTKVQQYEWYEKVPVDFLLQNSKDMYRYITVFIN